MKPALWLLLPSYGGRNTEPCNAAEELEKYRKKCFLRSRTPERAAEERLYNQQVPEWLRLPENKWCQVYLRLTGERHPATQCHHYQGRRGSLLLYREYWIPVSFAGHRYIDDHPNEARELGLLCPLGFYNSPVQSKLAA
jgi:hypothetical protein